MFDAFLIIFLQFCKICLETLLNMRWADPYPGRLFCYFLQKHSTKLFSPIFSTNFSQLEQMKKKRKITGPIQSLSLPSTCRTSKASKNRDLCCCFAIRKLLVWFFLYVSVSFFDEFFDDFFDAFFDEFFDAFFDEIFSI